MFSNYFHYSKNRTLSARQLLSILCLASLCMPIQSMDMNEDASPHEGTPLMAPSTVLMEDDSPLFDGTRRFYDDESRKKVRNAAIRKCLCASALSSAGCGCIGMAIGLPCSGILYGLGVAKGIVLKSCCGLILEPMVGSGGIMCVVSIPVMSITEGCHAASDSANDPHEMAWTKMLEISPEMINAADETKFIHFEKADLETLLERASGKYPDFPWPWLGKFVSCYYRQDNLVVARIKQRLVEDENNTLISEKELLYLLRDLTNYENEPPHLKICHVYARQALLAKNGWISFKQTDQYPMKCTMQYFDRDTLSSKAKKWYSLHGGFQTVYLPSTPEKLIRYYKFNADPAYQTNE